MAYDNTNFYGDLIVNEYDDKGNFMTPQTPTGYYVYHILGDGFDLMSEMCNQFMNDYSILTASPKSLDNFWGVSYNMPRPLLYEGQKADYLFIDNCTSTSNKSSGYVKNTGSYSFDSNGLEIESEPTDVLFTDDGTSASHNDNWNGLQYMTRTDTGTIINNTSGATSFVKVYLNGSDLPFTNKDFIVEFEIVENPSSTNRFRFDGQTLCDGETYKQWDYTFAQGETGKFKFVYDSTNNTIAMYKDGTYVKTITHHFCGKMGLIFRLENNASIKYKDFKVFKNYQANLRLDGSNVYDVPFTVEFDLLNDGNDNFRLYFHNTSFSNSAIGSGTLWTYPNGQTTKIRFEVTENGITRYINDTRTTLSLNRDVAEKVGVRLGYWQPTQSSIKIKNYKVYKGEEKERPLTDEEYKIYLYLRNCRLMTREDIEINMNKCFAVENENSQHHIFFSTETNYLSVANHLNYNSKTTEESNLAKNDEDTSLNFITNFANDDDTLLIESGLSEVEEVIEVINIPSPNGYDPAFLELLENYISVKGNLKIKEYSI